MASTATKDTAMPRNVSRSTHTPIPPQFEPPAPAPAPAPSAPPAASASSSGAQKAGRQKTSRQQKQMLAQMRAANETQAQQLGQTFAGYCDTMAEVEQRFIKLKNAASTNKSLCDAADARAAGETDPVRRAKFTKMADDMLDSAIKNYEDAGAAWDVRNADGKSLLDCASADLRKIDSAPNKNSLYTIDLHLKADVEQVRGGVHAIRRDQMAAATLANEGMARRGARAFERLGESHMALIRAFRNGGQAGARAALEGLVDQLGAVAETMAQCRARSEALAADCDEMLADPQLRDPAVIKDLHTFRQSCLYNSSANSLHITDNTELRMRILMVLAQHDNTGQPGRPELNEWLHDMTDAALAYHGAVAVNLEVMTQDRQDIDSAIRRPPDELAARLQAATDGADQFSAVQRAYSKHAKAYASLQGIVGNARLAELAAVMPDQLAECMRTRAYSAQLSAEQLDAIEAGKVDTAAYARASGAGRLQHTREGTVVGSINPAGGLDRVDQGGNVIASYFKDHDSGTWVRDYGDEAPVPAGASLVDKAHSLAARSSGVDRTAEAGLAANADYDDRVTLLLHAFSRKARDVAAMAGLLAELAPESAQATQVKGLLAGLREDKARLDHQLEAAKQAQNFHSHKTRDPNEASLVHLLKEGQASITHDLSRRPSQKNAADLIDRYTVSFKNGPRGEQYDDWVVHAHFGTTDAQQAGKVHLKRGREKDWGRDRQPYHAPVGTRTFDKIRELAAQKR